MNTKESIKNIGVGYEITHDKMLFNIVVSRITTVDGITMPTYGISRDGYRRDDITVNLKSLAKLVDILNRAGDISDCHIDFMIDDFLESQEEFE